MSDISFDELDAIQAGQTTADMFKKSANIIRNSACDAFRNSPGTFVPLPGQAAVYFLWDTFCGNSSGGLPPVPAPPNFSGGQCQTFYNVHATWEITHQDGSHFDNRDVIVEIYGPISKIELRDTANGVGMFIDFFNIRTNQADETNVTNGYAPAFHAQGLNIISVTRVDGLPDTCGDLPTKYPISDPPPTPTTPGGDTYNLPPISITFNDGSTQQLNASLTLNAAGVFPALNLGGINFSLGGGGITIGLGGGSGVGGATPNIDINAVLKYMNANVNTINDTANIINNTTNNIKLDTGSIKRNTDPPPPPGDPTLNPPDIKPPTDKKADGLTHLVSVQVMITKAPPSRYEQFGQGESSNVYYTGWFNWRQAGHDLEKLQITYLNQIFLAPKGVDGYGYTLTHGAQGYAIENTGKD